MRDVEGRTDAMAATIRMRQLQKDVTDVEEAELRRLEDGAIAGGDGDRPDVPETGGGASGGHPSGNDTQDGGAGVVVVGLNRCMTTFRENAQCARAAGGRRYTRG